MDNNSIKLKISLIINIIIVFFTIVALIIMFSGFKFMEGEYVLECTKLEMLKFFTVDSNIFMGVIALLFSIKQINVIKKKELEISSKIYVLKLIATCGVTLTFLTVFCYLGPIADGGIPSMIKNSNLFLHLLIPVLSILNFVLFERTDKIKFKYTFLGIIPTGLYSVFYLTNILIHMENGKVLPLYDWYWFVQGGIWQMIFVMPFMYGVTYLISVVLWRLNKVKINNN